MRIYAVADLHAKQTFIDRIELNIKHYHPDVLVIAGDLTNYFAKNNIISFIDNLDLPILFILGNSDFKRIRTILETSNNNAVCLSERPFIYEKMNFYGLNGTIPLPFASRICFQEKKALKKLEGCGTPDSVFVIHTPPKGFLDKVANKCSAGSSNLADFLQTCQPLLLLCGHIHEQSGFEMLSNTMVVNCAMNKHQSGTIIDIKDKQVEKIISINN